MPLPAILGALAPYLGSAAAGLGAGFLGSKLGGSSGGGTSPGIFSGTPAQTQQLPRFTPGQQSALDQLLSQALQGLGGTAIEDKARRGFAEQTIPSIAERFTAMGGGKLGSPALVSQLGQAGAGLESDLAAQKEGRLLNMLGLGLTPSFENIYLPSQPSPLGMGLGAAAPGVLGALLKYLGGSSVVGGQ